MNKLILHPALLLAMMTPLAAPAQTATPGQPATPAVEEARLQRGKQVFDHWCAACHDRGPGHPGTQALEARYDGALPAALEDRTNLTPGMVAIFVRNGISVMPFFRKTEISDEELAALGAYLSHNPTE